jgi:hypothetical protein
VKITITPNGDIEFDVDFTNGQASEAVGAILELRNLLVGQLSPVAPATAPTPTGPPATVVRRESAEARRKALALAERKANSRYYQLKASQGARTSRIVAETYDYIASYKNGRTTEQICEHFHTGKTTVWSRTASLLKDKLIVQPGGKGSPWVATNAPLELVPPPADHRPTPSDMPKRKQS